MKTLIKFLIYLLMSIVSILGLAMIGCVEMEAITIESAITVFAVVCFTFLILSMVQGLINMIEEGEDTNGKSN